MKTKTKNIQNTVFLTLKKLFSHLEASLLVILIGVFLWPNIAWLTTISNESIVNLTNQERIKNGLNTLSINQQLSEAALNKAQAILDTGQFSHTINDEKFSSWIKDIGYQYSYVGENLAIDFFSAEGVMRAWLDSPTHKKNILNNQFTEIGVAVVEDEFDGQKTVLVVQTFGTPIGMGMLEPFRSQTLGVEEKNSLYNLNKEQLLTNIAQDIRLSEASTPLVLSDLAFPLNTINLLKLHTRSISIFLFDKLSQTTTQIILNYLLISFLVLVLIRTTSNWHGAATRRIVR